MPADKVGILFSYVPPPHISADRPRKLSFGGGIIHRTSINKGPPASDPSEAGEVSKLLHAWSEGDRSALERLTPIIYKELHRLAGRYMRSERPGHSLQTTALVNEAYL